MQYEIDGAKFQFFIAEGGYPAADTNAALTDNQIDLLFGSDGILDLIYFKPDNKTFAMADRENWFQGKYHLINNGDVVEIINHHYKQH